MRAPVPLPDHPPCLTLYTPTYRRPRALARCLASVTTQTAAKDVEQIVIPDHVGYGLVEGLFGRMPWYAPAVRGRYVNILCDDDELASETVVDQVIRFAEAQDEPEVIIVRVHKGHLELPIGDPLAEPVPGSVDLTSYIVRGDIWHRHVADYGRRYEGDFDHAATLYRAGYRHVYCDLLWAIGGASHGRPEP